MEVASTTDPVHWSARSRRDGGSSSSYQKRPIPLKTMGILVACAGVLLTSVQPGYIVAAAWVASLPPTEYCKRCTGQFGESMVPRLCRTNLSTKLSSDNGFEVKNSYLESLLNRFGYSRRIVTLSSDMLPVLAELYDHGQLELCLITGFQLSSKNKWAPPLAEVQVISDEWDGRTVDIGQITTVWDVPYRQPLEAWRKEVETEINKFPVQHIDRSMQRLYQSRVGPSRKSLSSGLSKKQITKVVEECPDNGNRAHTESVLRRAVKAGPGMSRLADSSVAMDFLYNDYPHNKQDLLQRQIVGAHVLSQDAEIGGRFKRMPCTFISAQQDDASNTVHVTFNNGGWLAVDQSVRAGTEARKFVQRTERTSRGDDRDATSTSHNAKLKTAADERIAQRLECLAMGGIFSWENDGEEQQQEGGNLEVDVRETLKAMGLPTTPQGAEEALLRIGRWSQKPDHVRVEPWSQSALDAARWFSEMDRERRRQLQENSLSGGGQSRGSCLEERVDLTALPCVCVDARRTSFRDDAIGVRSRSSTGRKVVADASKYEILIHIADVSDIYAPQPHAAENLENLRVLRGAAESRGMSRYDLPLGPLHLMPPVALEALSFKTNNVDMTSRATKIDAVGVANRCVTLWAYIDERSGKVIDAGLERTLVSSPIALSFVDASDLLEGHVTDPSILSDGDNILRKAKAVLSVVERNLLLWNTQHRQSNEAARKRESRLSVKELVSKEMKATNPRDDGRDGFQRTRGHKLVDASLNLYGHGISSLLRRARKPIPRASGSGATRGGRVATAPLRRYIDGVAQRQALAVLCGYGGPPLTMEECKRANKIADEANNAISNYSATKKVGGVPTMNGNRQHEALRLLQADLARSNRPVPAMSTGRENEVTILGVGAIAKCRGVRGSLKPGARILVKVRKLDPEKGILSVSFVRDEQ